MKLKGQSAIEFLIIIGAVFFFFIAFLFGIQTSIFDRVKESKDLVVREIALEVQDEINLASESSSGYYREFVLPLEVVNLGYNVSIVEGLVYVITDNEKHAVAYPVAEVVGQPIKGNNIIRNDEGVIYLNS